MLRRFSVKMTGSWIGNQGLEFTSMGRVWQILLFVGLLLLVATLAFAALDHLFTEIEWSPRLGPDGLQASQLADGLHRRQNG